MTRYLAIAVGVLVLLLAGTGWLLKSSYERNGKLEQSVSDLSNRLKEKVDAQRDRERTDSDVRKLPVPDILERLR